jgi:hypothetical protein
MQTIAVDKRAFHHKLRAPKAKEPEPQPGMTPDEIKVAEITLAAAEKACYEFSKWLLNLSIAIKNPSPAQADILRERVRGLKLEVQNMLSIFSR